MTAYHPQEKRKEITSCFTWTQEDGILGRLADATGWPGQQPDSCGEEGVRVCARARACSLIMHHALP